MKSSDFRVEEQIYDIQKRKKILTETFIKNYLKGDGLKMISTLNNKIIVQFDEKCNLFSVKSSGEAGRYIDSLSQHFYNINRKDCMFVKDESTAQKKYLFELLFNLGIDKRILYRQYTTHPRG